MATKKTIKKGELGGSGTTVYGGVVSEVEYNQTLSTAYGGSGLKVYNRMRKSDPIVKSTLSVIKLGIKQGEWFVEPASDDSRDKKIAEFVEEALFKRMTRSWDEVLQDVLTYLDFGFYVGEKVFKVEDNFIWWKKLAYRSQASIMKFETKEKKDGVTQQLSGEKIAKGDESQPSIPIEKLLIFTNEKEGDNWRGVSVLRSAYKPWFIKENLEKIDAIGFERNAVGIPIFKMPANPDDKDVEKAEELGKNLRANEKAYLLLPYEWDFILEASKYDGKGIQDAIRLKNRDIFSNVLANFLDLGAGTTGSRALSVDQSEAFYRSLQAIADYVASIWNEHAIKQLVDLNFDNVTKYPELKVTGIEKVDVERFSSGLQRLGMSGMIIPDDELEAFIRNKLRLPEKVEVEEREEETTTTQKKTPPKEEEEKEEPTTVKASEKKKRKFSYIKTWRPITLAEEKVNLLSLSRQIDNLQADIVRELPKVMAAEITGLLNDARQALQTGDVKRVEDMIIKFKVEIREVVLASLSKAFEIGKMSASNEMNVAAPKTTTELINLLTTRANAITGRLTNKLLDQAKLTVIQQIEQGTEVDDALKALETILTDEIQTSIGLTGSVTTMGGINQGRASVFDEYPEKIYAVQRSEILDERICNFCLSMDGRVVQKDDKIVKSGSFHFRCRGIWVEILVEETDKPKIGGVPAQLRERIGTLMEFDQLKAPIPLVGSLAEEFVKKRKK